MGPFSNPAGKGIGYKGGLKNAIHHVENCMMQDSISDTRFMYVAAFRITNIESAVRSMLVSLISDLSVKLKNILFQVALKFHHIRFLSFSSLEFIPSQKQSLGAAYFIK